MTLLNNHEIRGLRNNNPGNLIKTNIKWQGKIKSSDTRFEQFETMEYGIRAMALDLVSDIRKGKNTIKKLITEYAPAHENDTNAYIQNVCQTVGFDQNAKIEFVNAKFLSTLIRAIIKVELGAPHKLITDSSIKSALKMIDNSDRDNIKLDLSDTSSLDSNIGATIGIIALFFYTFFTLTH